jgi:[ribosomal protein S18]-alanine N-acetyltransferase
MMNLLRSIPMTPADLVEIMPLERRCFKDPWTRHMYLSDLTGNALATYLVLRLPAGATARKAEQGTPPSLLAYGGFWLLLDEAHIATIASHPDWRGCGLGQWLMLALLDQAIARGAALATLEVRVGNTPARRLYEKLGFEEVGERRNYYRDGEDALIMTTPSLHAPALQERLAAARIDAAARLEACFTAAPSGAQRSYV